jgi:hypothetical protein
MGVPVSADEVEQRLQDLDTRVMRFVVGAGLLTCGVSAAILALIGLLLWLAPSPP